MPAMLARELDAYTAFREDPRRAGSAEVDFGWWREGDWPYSWRITWIERTGEVYAMGARPPRLILLGDFPGALDDVRRALEGWEDRCNERDSLRWAMARLYQGPGHDCYADPAERIVRRTDVGDVVLFYRPPGRCVILLPGVAGPGCELHHSLACQGWSEEQIAKRGDDVGTYMVRGGIGLSYDFPGDDIGAAIAHAETYTRNLLAGRGYFPAATIARMTHQGREARWLAGFIERRCARCGNACVIPEGESVCPGCAAKAEERS